MQVQKRPAAEFMDSAAHLKNGAVEVSTCAGSKDSACTFYDFCFLLFVAIFCLLKALGFYEGQTFFTIGLVIAFCLLLIKLAGTQMSITEWVVVICLLGMGGLVYFNTGEKSLLVNLAFLAGLKPSTSGRTYRNDSSEIPPLSNKGRYPVSGGYDNRSAFNTAFSDRIMKTGLMCWGLGYILLTFLSLTGLHSDLLFMHNKKGIGYVICHSLGYSHSNVLHINYLCICAMILYLVRNRLSKRGKLALTALLFAIDLYVFLYSVSFTGFLASLILFILYLYLTFRVKISRTGQFLAQLILPCCLLFSLVGPIVIKGKLFDRINNALNTRYELTRWFLTNQPITAFGTRITVPNYRYTLDCSYAYLFVRLGVVPFAVLMALYIGTIHRLAKEQRMTELAIMLSLCIAGVAEPFLFNLSFKNITLLFVGEYLFDLPERILLLTSAAKRKAESRQFCILKRGKCISDRWLFADHFIHFCGRILHEWKLHWKGYLLTALVIMIAAGTLTIHLIKPVETVYVNSTVNQASDSHFKHFYLSEDEVISLEEQGDLVYGYIDDQEAMYPYGGSTARIEYVRIVASAALWTCTVVVIMITIAGIVRSTIIGAHKFFE